MNLRKTIKISVPVAVATFFCLSLPVPGHAASQEQQSPAGFDSIWNLSELYKNNENPYIQKFDLVGRYHGQYWIADSEGNYDNDWQNRRMYVGFNAKFF